MKFLQPLSLTLGLLALVATTTFAADAKYEVVPNFFETTPDNQPIGACHGGVVLDKAGNMYVTTDTARGILVFSPAGKFVRAFGPTKIHGLEIREENGAEVIYAARPSAHEVIKLKLDGTQEWALTFPAEAGIYKDAGKFNPCAVTVGPDGSIFVADGYGKSWIHHYSHKGKLVRTFGGPGKDRGQVSCPHGIAIDTRGAEPLIVVADRSNRRLQNFSLGGQHRGFVTDELRSPCHFDQRGKLLLVPDLDARVTLLNEKNELVVHLGDGTNYGLRDKPREQFADGKFIAPHSACFDAAGNIFVVEWVEIGRVTKLRKV